MRPISSSSRGNRDPADPARAMRRRRERLIEQALEAQRRLHLAKAASAVR